MEGRHFVSDAAHRPNITLEVVGFVAPHLWTRVVRGPRLGVIETVLAGQLGYIEVAHLDDVVVSQEYIRRLI